MDLIKLKESIEQLSKFHQIEILKILKKTNLNMLNENKNGTFVNLTNVDEKTIGNINLYLQYVIKQEKHLNDVELEKDNLTNTYFKDNKDNVSLTLNA